MLPRDKKTFHLLCFPCGIWEMGSWEGGLLCPRVQSSIHSAHGSTLGMRRVWDLTEEAGRGFIALTKTLIVQSDENRGWEQENTFKESLDKVEADADGRD